MSRKILKRSIFLTLGILLLWVVLAQSCMKMRISDSDARQQFEAAGVPLKINSIKVNGYPLHYVQTGNYSLPTLFFVHGSPGSWDAFKVYLQDKDLLAKYRMVSIDRPGFGYSSFGNALNLADQSTIISALLQHIKNDQPVYIVGHSLGGPLAVKLVADNPAQFSGLVLLAASVDPAHEAPEKWRGFLYYTPFKYLLPGAFRPSNTEIWYLKKDLLLLAKDFGQVTCKVWIMHGDKDGFVPVENAIYAQRMLKNAASVKLIIIPGAPHFIPWEPWYKEVKGVLLQIN